MDKTDKNTIEELLPRYCEGLATEEERLQVEMWMDESENKPMVIGGGTYAKSLKNIIAFGPEMPGIDYRIHGADEFILVSGMEQAVLVYIEAIKNLLAI